MSPEQAKGGVVDARTDLYSLACVGFYALSGEVPFSGPSAAAILIAHVNEPAPHVLEVAPHVPPGVATALNRCLRKDPEQRFSGGEALADALQPEVEADRELALPLRVFIKQSREWETTLVYSLGGLGSVVWVLIALISNGDPPGVPLGWAAAVATLLAVPVLSLVRVIRRLLKSGFTQADATVAFLRDIDRREEEYRFEVGERVTWVDRAARVLKLGGFSAGALSVALWIASQVWLDPQFEFFGMFSLLLINAGTAGLLIEELRARGRGDIMGERYLRLWKSKLGKKLFSLGDLKLKRVAPALGAGVHRATEVVTGLEADRLFEELPEETRESLGNLPETVQALEADAQAMRKQVAEMEGVLAEIGDDDPSRPSAAERARVRASVEATRDDAKESSARLLRRSRPFDSVCSTCRRVPEPSRV